jgi:hypothetical protein
MIVLIDLLLPPMLKGISNQWSDANGRSFASVTEKCAGPAGSDAK